MNSCLNVLKAGWILAVAWAVAEPIEAQIPADGVTVITGVTLIDGTGGDPMADVAVRIEFGRIAAIESASTYEVPEGAEVIDAQGAFLLPGFIDTHAHLTLGPVELDMTGPVPAMNLKPDPTVPLRTMQALMAHGITSVRDPGGNPKQLVALREAVASGVIVGPRMKVAGMVIDMAPFDGLVNQVQNADDVRAAVRADAEAGVDMAKLYVTLGPDMLEAGIDEARSVGIESVAHLMMTSWTEAAEFGIDNILHIIPSSPKLLPEENRAEYMSRLPRGTQFMYEWFQYADFDGPEIQEMMAALLANDVSIDPTLVVFEAMVRGDDPFFTENPALRLATPSMVHNWQTFFTFNVGWGTEDFAAGRDTWPLILEFTRRLHDAGVVLTAGTDANNPWVVPGDSFHRELQLLVDAGIPNAEVLKIATHNGALVSGFLEETGTVEVGKWADLVLLNTDPLADIGNTRDIRWVMQAGRLMDPNSLVATLEAAR